MRIFRFGSLAILFGLLALNTAASAASVSVKVTVKNLVPENGVSFAPLRLGFGNGTFDSFNIGEAATAPIISIAEGGSGSDWFPAFAAAEPNAVLGSVGGALLPGQSASSSFIVNPATNRYFTFASMVIPSNDFFIGNDDPMEYQLFDANGDLQITSILQNAGEIWDAGSEAFDPANAAFLVGGTNALRTPQNSVVSFNFAELAGFNGLETAGGYFLNSQLSASTPIYEISFSVSPVPEPSTMAITGLMAATGLIRFIRRRRNA